LIRRY